MSESRISDPVQIVSQEFEAARAAFEGFCLLHEDTDKDPAINAEYERLFDRICEFTSRIASMKATDLPSLQLKARALLWCNDDLDFTDGDTTDERLARGIVFDLLSLPTIGVAK